MALTSVQVVQHLRPGGIESMVLDLQAFAQEPGNSYIVSLEGNPEQLLKAWPRLRSVANRLIFIDKPPGVQWPLVNALVEVFKQLKPQVVHTHHIGPLFYAGVAARMAGVQKVVHTEHDAWHLNSLKRRLLAWSLLRLVKPVLVADAGSVAQVVQEKLYCENAWVIHNGIDIDKFKPGDKLEARRRLGLPRDRLVIGVAARLVSEKGHLTLLRALQQLPKNVHLVLAGTGPDADALKYYVWHNHLSDRVDFLGHIEDMPSFYQALDIFCLPSRKEGFPLSTLEAQACGICVVASDVGGVKETLCPVSSRLFRVDDVEQLASRLLEMTNIIKHCQLTVKPRDFVTNSLDIHTMVKRYYGIYTSEVA
jgi:glycosyltransferase involved in cell wall biosynthesis